MRTAARITVAAIEATLVGLMAGGVVFVWRVREILAHDADARRSNRQLLEAAARTLR